MACACETDAATETVAIEFGTAEVYVTVSLAKLGLSVPALSVRALNVVTVLGVLNVATLA